MNMSVVEPVMLIRLTLCAVSVAVKENQTSSSAVPPHVEVTPEPVAPATVPAVTVPQL